jgi:hypothetical protein
LIFGGMLRRIGQAAIANDAIAGRVVATDPAEM